MKTRSLIIALFVSLLYSVSASAQQRMTFRVADFHHDQMDMTARNEQYKRTDDSGDMYAIIKVRSDRDDDDLAAYRFDFGLMNSFIELHEAEDELWVYVQRNAKTVTISREGYKTVSKYDLRTTITAGATYSMLISASAPVVYTQMVEFRVNPPTAKAMISVRSDRPDAIDEPLGIVDENGAVARALPFGTYTYHILAQDYYPSEGMFTLNNRNENHVEQVTLRGNFGTVTLTVDSDADIFVDGERKGLRTWTGTLRAGSHQVECRQQSHRPAQQSITVAEGETASITLPQPTPITGTLSITSRPLGATIMIDGKEYGQTPRNITNLIVGHHKVELTASNHRGGTKEFDIEENQTTNVDVELAENVVASTGSDVQTFTVTGHGKTVSFKMIKVEPGTFQMGREGSHDVATPVHRVTLTKAYYMGETEVTQALWYAVMGQSISQMRDKASRIGRYFLCGEGDNYPAYYINYKDCEKFLTKLNKLTGQQFRFPTEAEWEFAAKGGVKSKGYTYAGSNTIDYVAWYTSNSGRNTHEVGTRQANELGLYDMSGNVYEWCYDWYGSYSSSPSTDPMGPTTGSRRVVRGGDWHNNATSCRVAYRNNNAPSFRYYNFGLRLAL